jgi:hypothetical protein
MIGQYRAILQLSYSLMIGQYGPNYVEVRGLQNVIVNLIKLCLIIVIKLYIISVCVCVITPCSLVVSTNVSQEHTVHF